MNAVKSLEERIKFFNQTGLMDFFGDGKLVPAYRHHNENDTTGFPTGGIIAVTAKVAYSAYLSPTAMVCENGVVCSHARIEDDGFVCGNARVGRDRPDNYNVIVRGIVGDDSYLWCNIVVEKGSYVGGMSEAMGGYSAMPFDTHENIMKCTPKVRGRLCPGVVMIDSAFPEDGATDAAEFDQKGIFYQKKLHAFKDIESFSKYYPSRERGNFKPVCCMMPSDRKSREDWGNFWAAIADSSFRMEASQEMAKINSFQYQREKYKQEKQSEEKAYQNALERFFDREQKVKLTKIPEEREQILFSFLRIPEGPHKLAIRNALGGNYLGIARFPEDSEKAASDSLKTLSQRSKEDRGRDHLTLVKTSTSESPEK